LENHEVVIEVYEGKVVIDDIEFQGAKYSRDTEVKHGDARTKIHFRKVT
jgi:hypothetical protein